MSSKVDLRRVGRNLILHSLKFLPQFYKPLWIRIASGDKRYSYTKIHAWKSLNEFEMRRCPTQSGPLLILVSCVCVCVYECWWIFLLRTKSMRRSKTCTVCISNLKDCTAYPCKHIQTCMKCCKNLTHCPICWLKITCRECCFSMLQGML